MLPGGRSVKTPSLLAGLLGLTRAYLDLLRFVWTCLGLLWSVGYLKLVLLPIGKRISVWVFLSPDFSFSLHSLMWRVGEIRLAHMSFVLSTYNNCLIHDFDFPGDVPGPFDSCGVLFSDPQHGTHAGFWNKRAFIYRLLSPDPQHGGFYLSFIYRLFTSRPQIFIFRRHRRFDPFKYFKLIKNFIWTPKILKKIVSVPELRKVKKCIISFNVSIFN